MSLPHQIFIIKTSLWVPCHEALRLIRDKRAREVYEDGQFLGIELHARPEERHELLPPAELPGLVFDDPAPERKYARFHWKYA